MTSPLLRTPSFKAWCALAVFVVCLHLLGLGSHGLFEPDEGRYANMALEWTEFSDHSWLEPTLADVGHFDKPPLINWAAGTSLLLFGPSEFALRLPSFAGGMLTLVGIALLAARTRGPNAAWWSVLVASTTLQFWALTHLLSPDMLMCGFLTLGTGLILWPLEINTNTRKALFWWVGTLCWTLAWWTKATAALIPLLAITCAFALAGRRDLLKRLKPLRLLAVVLGLGLPWYFLMANRHPELWDFFLHRELAGRVLGHPDDRDEFFGFHLVVAAGFWLPWWPLLPGPVVEAWRRRADRGWLASIRSIPWEVIAAILVVLLFSFLSSKLPTYILTGVPFLAVAAGDILSREEFTFRRWPARVAALGAAILMGIAVAVPRVESSLGGNSSLRQVIAEARRLGADWLLCDEFWPSVEHYFGEQVIFVGDESQLQVIGGAGQTPVKHFSTRHDIRKRVRNLEGSLWVLERRNPSNRSRHWQTALREENDATADPESVTIGSFYLWKVR